MAAGVVLAMLAMRGGVLESWTIGQPGGGGIMGERTLGRTRLTLAI